MSVFSSTTDLPSAPVQDFESALRQRERDNFLRLLYLAQFPEAGAACIYAATMAGQIGWSLPIIWLVATLSAIVVRLVVLNRALALAEGQHKNIKAVLVANFTCGFCWGVSIYYLTSAGGETSLYISMVWMVGLLVSALGLAAVSSIHPIVYASPAVLFLLSKLFGTGEQIFILMAVGLILLLTFFGAIVYFTRAVLRRDFYREMQNASLVKQLSESNAYSEQLNKELRAEIAGRERVERALILQRDEAEKLSTIDSLTGISNRRAFDSALIDELARARRNQHELSLILIDVDRFKNYNDARGHIAGDHVLRRVAKIIERSTRRGTDKSCRYGGEEFAVFLPNTDLSRATKIAESIRICLENEKIAHPDSDVESYVTVSIGVSCIDPQSSQAGEYLLEAADEALYAAKSQGRNRTQHSH